MAYKVVVVGATGNVGREMLNILAEREFPLADIAAVASPRSTGDIIDFGETGRELKVHNIEHFDFAGWDIALFAAGSGPAKIYAPKAAAAGCTNRGETVTGSARMVAARSAARERRIIMV